MDAGELDPLIAWLLGRAGLKSSAYRPTAMQRRVPACLRQLRVDSVESARALLERRPELLPVVLNTALIGVSEFFRDQPVFECVEKNVVPALARLRRSLRVCSAGVSGGQEIYSVAMLLAEAGVLGEAVLLGVDCRADAIRRAREGFYGAEDMSGVTPERRERFFEPSNGRWAVRPELKARIQWGIHDLLDFDAGGPCDLILFRNVAIYFNEPHSCGVWTHLCDQLAPGGFIVTGKAERPPSALPLVRIGPSVYRKASFDI
jgi:chemotaxis protein methyltransferase CheR